MIMINLQITHHRLAEMRSKQMKLSGEAHKILIILTLKNPHFQQAR